MLTYSFENIGATALYEYLYQCIRKDILNGTLPAGYKLPSKRSFAKNLNISVTTVENAYAQLIAEGYLTSIPKKGYFIANFKQEFTNKLVSVNFSASNVNQRQAQIVSNDTRNNLSASKKREFFADFVTNSVPPEYFPFSIWAKLMRNLLNDKQKELLTPSPTGGILELRQAIAKHLLQFRGINVSPEQVIIGAGTEYLYGLLIQLLGRKHIFAIEDPSYQKIAQIYHSHGITCRYIPLDDFGINMKALQESTADIIHISPSHHYPTGIITPISRRYELLGWASQKEGRYIIEDDYDCEFRLLGKPIPALQSIDVMEKVIFMNTFTKSLAPTIRISYMILPPHLLKKYQKELQFYSCTVSNFEQYTLADFISKGYFEKHINRMRNFYRTQRDFLIKCIKKSPWLCNITIKEEHSGLHFLLTIQTGCTSEEFIRLAAAEGVRISCLTQYYHKNAFISKQKETTIIINYSGIKPDNIEEAVKRLGNVISYVCKSTY